MKRVRAFILPILLILLVFGVYANSLNNGFVSDDISGIVQTAHMWTFPWAAVTETVIHAHMLVWYVVYVLFGLAPWAFRLANILCHAVSVLLVYKIVFQLVNRRIGFITSALFAVHPIIIESVTWISGGIYCQYGMLFLLSFWLYIQNRRRGTESRGQKTENRKQTVYYLASFFTYCVCLLFSEKAGVLFLLFFLYEFCFGNLKKNWRKLMPYLIVSCIFILFYMTQLGVRITSVGQSSGGGGGPGWYNPLVQLPFAITSYFELIVWPKNLTLYHETGIFYPWEYCVRLFVFLGYCAALLVTAMKNRKLFFWLLWFLIPLLPTLTPLKIAWLVAERYAYLSVICIFVLIAYGFEWVLSNALLANENLDPSSVASSVSSMKRRPKEQVKPDKILFASRAFLLTCIVTVPIVFMFLALIMRTVVRNRDWQSEDTLWIATAKTSPSIPFTWNNMGDVYSRHGDDKKAAEMFQRAITLNPRYADAYHNLAETYRDMGETGDAILMYEKALVFNPNLWQSHGSLAGIYYNKKEYQKALIHIEAALKIVPDNQMLLQAREQLKKMLK
jgi:hypothetical protein